MNRNEYQDHDGLGLSELLTKGEVTPTELMDCAIDIAEQVNPQLNALCFTEYDLGRERAREATLRGHFGAGVAHKCASNHACSSATEWATWRGCSAANAAGSCAP